MKAMILAGETPSFSARSLTVIPDGTLTGPVGTSGSFFGSRASGAAARGAGRALAAGLGVDDDTAAPAGAAAPLRARMARGLREPGRVGGHRRLLAEGARARPRRRPALPGAAGSAAAAGVGLSATGAAFAAGAFAAAAFAAGALAGGAGVCRFAIRTSILPRRRRRAQRPPTPFEVLGNRNVAAESPCRDAPRRRAAAAHAGVRRRGALRARPARRRRSITSSPPESSAARARAPAGGATAGALSLGGYAVAPSSCAASSRCAGTPQ